MIGPPPAPPEITAHSWWELLWAPATLAVLALALLVHQRVRAWLPEDHPRGGRKNHERPTPMAGLVIPVLLMAVVLWHGAWWIAGAILLAGGCGAWDDTLKDRAGDAEARTGDPTWQLDAGLPWQGKAIALLGAAVLLGFDTTGTDALWPLLGSVMLAFVVINAVNFLDNTDGVAAMIVAAGTLGICLAGEAPSWAVPVAAVALGFLPCNWPRPHMFLGDGGALALGCALAALTLRTPGELGIPGPATALVPLLDFIQVVTVRLWLAIPPWCGDRRHLPHLLLHIGAPRALVAPLLAGVALAAAWTLA